MNKRVLLPHCLKRGTEISFRNVINILNSNETDNENGNENNNRNNNKNDNENEKGNEKENEKENDNGNDNENHNGNSNENDDTTGNIMYINQPGESLTETFTLPDISAVTPEAHCKLSSPCLAQPHEAHGRINKATKFGSRSKGNGRITGWVGAL